MPLTAKGEEIKSAMVKQYGEKKGEQVLYASKNKGTISGIDSRSDTIAKLADAVSGMLTRSVRMNKRMDALEEADREFTGPDGKQDEQAGNLGNSFNKYWAGSISASAGAKAKAQGAKAGPGSKQLGEFHDFEHGTTRKNPEQNIFVSKREHP